MGQPRTGQVNLRDAVRREISFDDPASGKSYKLGDKLATLIVRPRGLHLPERHMEVDGQATRGSLFDFGLTSSTTRGAHRARERTVLLSPEAGVAPRSRLWNDVFVAAQEALGIPRGTIRATVLIETLPAAFEMDEILFALREHAAGLNCGRWDYIFSHHQDSAARSEGDVP